MSHTPPVDSKGAAIDEINLIISTVMLGVKRVVNKYNNPQIAPKQMNDELDEVYHEARQAILAILTQEVKRVIGEDEKIDEGDELVHDKFTRNDLRAEIRRRANQ